MRYLDWPYFTLRKRKMWIAPRTRLKSLHRLVDLMISVCWDTIQKVAPSQWTPETDTVLLCFFFFICTPLQWWMLVLNRVNVSNSFSTVRSTVFYCVMSKTEAILSCPQLAVKTHRWPRGSTVWRYVWRAWEWQTWIPTYWPAERETIRVPKTQAKQQNTCLWHAKHRRSTITDTVRYYVVNTACWESC